MLQNASIFEVGWTAISLLDVFLFLVIGYFAYGDQRYVRTPLAGVIERRGLTIRRIVAVMNMSLAILLGGMDVFFATGGIIAMTLPNAPAATTLSATGAIFLLSFFLGHVCITGVGIVLLVSRSRILAKAEADYDHLMGLRTRAGVEDKA